MPARLLRLLPVPLQLRELGGTSDELPPHELVQRAGGRRLRLLDLERRKLGGKVRRDQLADGLRVGQAAQPERAELAQRRALGQARAHGVRHRPRQQGLPAVARGGDALRPHQRQRGHVFAVLRLRLADMHAHAHAEGADRSPILMAQRMLAVERRLQRGIGGCERRTQAVADDLEDAAIVCFDGAPHERVVARERILHRLRMPLEELGRPFDVGEEESDGTGGKVAHASLPVGRRRRPLLAGA